VVDAFAVVVTARVTDVMRSVWLRMSERWSRRICCCARTVRSTPRQALVAASDGVAGVVAEPVGVATPVDSGLTVLDVLAASEAEETVAGVLDEEDGDGKNGAPTARAVDAWPRSAVTAFKAPFTRCWALARACTGSPRRACHPRADGWHRRLSRRHSRGGACAAGAAGGGCRAGLVGLQRRLNFGQGGLGSGDRPLQRQGVHGGQSLARRDGVADGNRHARDRARDGEALTHLMDLLARSRHVETLLHGTGGHRGGPIGVHCVGVGVGTGSLRCPRRPGPRRHRPAVPGVPMFDAGNAARP
jgi:hypothetical protein